MERFDEMLEELKALNLQQNNMEWEEDLYGTSLWNKYFDTEDYRCAYELVMDDLDIDEHRWYETSITVLKMYGRFLGLRHISKTYGEMTEVEDICGRYYFFEMEEVPSVTYKEKK